MFYSSAVSALNSSISRGTWSRYGTAVRHLLACQVSTGVPISFPLDDHQLGLYVTYCVVTRGVNTDTAWSYIGSL